MTARRRGSLVRGGDGGFQIFTGGGCYIRGFSHPDLMGGTVMTFTEPQKAAIMAALYDPVTGIGLTRARTVDATISGAGAPYDFTYQASRLAAFNYGRLDGEADWFARAQAVYPALTTWISPIRSETWMTGFTSTTPDAEKVDDWADWLLTFAERCAAQGAPLTHLSVVNEPNYTRFPMSAQFIRDTIKNLGPRLVSAGLAPGGIVITDDLNATNAGPDIDIIMADATARQYVTALACHPYEEAEGSFAQMQARAATWNLPLWQTEMGKSTLASMPGSDSSDLGLAVAIHNMLALYNCAAVDTQVGAFGEQVSDSLVELPYTGSTYDGTPVIKRAGYYAGQFWKFVRPGMRRVAITTSNSSVKVSAWRDGTARTIVAINPTAGSLAPVLTSEMLGKVASMSVVRSSAAENWAAQSAQAVTAQSFTPTLPASSVTTFTATAAV